MFFISELEEQRSGKNKATAINRKYINSAQYRQKFDKISTNPKLNRLLYKLAKKILFHRTGTAHEDMYWVDLDTLEIVASETKGAEPSRIIYSDATKKVLQQNRSLITIHSHPSGFPPSIQDLNSNCVNNYQMGIVIGHNGKVYLYSAKEEISYEYYRLKVATCIKDGYTEEKAHINVLYSLQNLGFDIIVKEVIADEILRR